MNAKMNQIHSQHIAVSFFTYANISSKHIYYLKVFLGENILLVDIKLI